MTLGPDVRTSDTESPAGRELATASLTCALAAEAVWPLAGIVVGFSVNRTCLAGPNCVMVAGADV